jgi:hypothetical protein
VVGNVRFEFFPDGTGKHFTGAAEYAINWTKKDAVTFSITGITARDIVITSKSSADELEKNKKSTLQRMK